MMNQRRIDAGICLAIIGSAFLVLLPFSVIGVDVHHDGIMLKPAVDVAEGQMLHRETFSQYGPLTTMTHAALLILFGKKLIVLRIATALMYSLSLGALFLTWRMILPLSLSLVSVCIWFCLVPFYRLGWHVLPWSSSEALLIQSVCLWVMTVAQLQRKAENALLLIIGAGGLASAVFWCRQPVGGLLAISGASIPMFLQWQFQGHAIGLKAIPVHFFFRNRFLWGYVIGGVVPALVMLAWLFCNGAVESWYEQNILWPRAFASGNLSFRGVYQCFGTTQIVMPSIFIVLLLLLPRQLTPFRYPQLWKGGLVITFGTLWIVLVFRNPELFTLIIFEKLIPIAVVFLVVILAFKRDWSAVLACSRLGLLFPILASWMQFYPVPCFRHVFWGVCPTLGLFVFLLGRTFQVSQRHLAVCILLVLMPLATQRILEAQAHLMSVGEQITGIEFLEGMRPYEAKSMVPFFYQGSEEDYLWLSRVYQRIRLEWPGSRLIINGNDAMLSLLSEEKTNPGPFYVTWPQLEMFGLWEARNNFVREHRPLILVEGEIALKQDFMTYFEQGYEEEFLGVAFGKEMYLLVPSTSRSVK